MAPTPLRFRNATHADTPAIVEVLNQTFRTQIDATTWEWYVYGNPLGHSQVYLAFEPDGRIVGTIAFAPTLLRLCGEVLDADFAHHLVLLPAYRDTLSFVALNRHALQAQAARGRRRTSGPPNQTAYPSHKTIMKWVDFGHLECLRKLSPPSRPHLCQRVTSFPSDFDTFAREFSRDLAFCVEKNQIWVNWRFCARPGSPYTVYTISRDQQTCGYVVLKSWRDPDGYRKAHILDLHARDHQSLVELVAAAESYADGCDEINLWAVQGYVYGDALRTMGYAPNPSAHQPFIARPYDGRSLIYPSGRCSFGYGDGDTLY
jgi:GNAT superfamily N-acetyltransferase